MAVKPGMMLYHADLRAIDNLDPIEYKQLIQALLAASEGNPITDAPQGAAGMAYRFMLCKLEHDNAHYQEVCARNRENGRASANARQRSLTVDDDCTDSSTVATNSNSTATATATGNVTPTVTPTVTQVQNETIVQHDAADELFDELWSEYPRKEGKANVSYTQKLKIASKVGREKMLAAIDAYKRATIGKDREYILMGSTFFNGRYEDYLEEASTDDVNRVAYAYTEPDY